MAKKRVGSIKKELMRKAREAMMAAVQVYNNPQMTFKTEAFITMAVIGWTYLLHAFYRSKGIDYRYFHNKGNRKIYDKTKYGAIKSWELERCLNDSACPLDSNTIANLRFLIGIRHEIEHQMANNIDELISAKLQACALNFDYYIRNLFGDKCGLSCELSLVIQFSPLTPQQRDSLINNPYVTSNVKNFVVGFENSLTDEMRTSQRYEYRVLFIPIDAKRRGREDQIINFIKSDDASANGVRANYTILRETEKRKFLPSEIVSIIKGDGYDKFTINKHTELWKFLDAKNQKFSYGVQISKTWYWYESWLNKVREYCRENADKFKS